MEIASLGIQVHGGMGFIEETGAAKPLRDARIGPIYEGTTGIQALDLIGRKLASDGGAAFADFAADIHAELAAYAARGRGLIGSIVAAADAAVALNSRRRSQVVDGMGRIRRSAPRSRCRCCAWRESASAAGCRPAPRISRRRLAEGGADPRFLKAKLDTARFYARADPAAVAAGLDRDRTRRAGSVLDSDSALL